MVRLPMWTFLWALVAALSMMSQVVECPDPALRTEALKALEEYPDKSKKMNNLVLRIGKANYAHTGKSKAYFRAQIIAQLDATDRAYKRLLSLYSNPKSGNKSSRIKEPPFVEPQYRTYLTKHEEKEAREQLDKLKDSKVWFKWVEHLLERQMYYTLAADYEPFIVEAIKDAIIEAKVKNGKDSTKLKSLLEAIKQAQAEYKLFWSRTLDSVKFDVTPTLKERAKHDKEEERYQAKLEKLYKISEVSKLYKMPPSKPFYMKPKTYLVCGKAFVIGAVTCGLAYAFGPDYFLLANQTLDRLRTFMQTKHWGDVLTAEKTPEIKDQALPKTDNIGPYLIFAFMVIALLALLVLVFMFERHYRSKSGSKKSDKGKASSLTLNAKDSVILVLDDSKTAYKTASKTGSKTASKTASKTGSNSSRSGPSASSTMVSTSKTN